MNEVPSKRAIARQEEELIDLCERVLWEAVARGDKKAIRFVSGTQAAQRRGGAKSGERKRNESEIDILYSADDDEKHVPNNEFIQEPNIASIDIRDLISKVDP